MNDRRLRRLEEQIKERIALVVLRDLQDPRLGFLTITRVELDRELEHCNVYWSVLGDEAELRVFQRRVVRIAGLVVACDTNDTDLSTRRFLGCRMTSCLYLFSFR